MHIRVTAGQPEPYPLSRFRHDHPNVLYFGRAPSDALLRQHGVYRVTTVPEPRTDAAFDVAVRTIEPVGEEWTEVWTVEERPLAEARPVLLERIAAARYATESQGLVWRDVPAGRAYYFDTTVESQNRFAAARAAIAAGIRVDGGVWKCAEVVDGDFKLAYRPTTNAELAEIAGQVHAHVQTCFEAEARAGAKVAAATTIDALRAVSFADEYNALTSA